jgi:protein SDA1
LPLLTATPSKTLRQYIFKTTLSTLKDANKQKNKSPNLNRTVQTLLFSFVGNRPFPGLSRLGSTSSTPPGVWAVKITSEMWKRGIWNDARSVELMKEAACSDVLFKLGLKLI